MSRVSRLRIFVASSALPKPDENAGDRRLSALIELLARHHRVDLWLGDPPASADTDRYLSLVRATGAHVLGWGWSGYVSAMTSTQYHLGVFEFYHTAAGLMADFRRRQPGARVVIDSVDIHFAREADGAALGVIDAAAARETATRELAAYRSADAVIVVTDADARLLEHAGGVRQLFVIPLIIPVRTRSQGRHGRGLLFVGSFRHPPNADGIRWFMSEVWPLIAAEEPETTLDIVGSRPPPEVRAFGESRGVTVHGFVADLDALLSQATVSIAPLRYGGGMKGKVCEALAWGIPVVTTSAGVQGLPVQSGTELLVGDDAPRFAAGVLSLLRDSAYAEGIEAAGQRAAASYAPETVERQVDDMIAALAPNPRAFGPRLAWLRASAAHTLRAVGRRVMPG